MTEPTDDELIARALEIREDIEAMKASHAAELEPYEMGLQDIENALLARMVQRGAKSIGTMHGTCYQSHQLRVKVADREKWMDWLTTEGCEYRVREFVTNHVSKEAVKEYMESPYHAYKPPDGIDATTFVQCNIRKA